MSQSVSENVFFLFICFFFQKFYLIFICLYLCFLIIYRSLKWFASARPKLLWIYSSKRSISLTRRKRLFCDSDWRFGHGVIQSTVACSKAGPTPSAYILPASGLTTVFDANRTGRMPDRRKRPVDEESMESAAKRPIAEEYFTVKSVKQVNVRKFRTTGTDFFFYFILLVKVKCSNMPLNVKTYNEGWIHDWRSDQSYASPVA